MPYEKDLVCMRQNEMRVIHPRTDFTHLCAARKEPVGIFPSGQGVLASHRPDQIRIICNRCFNAQQYTKLIYANRDLDKLDVE